MVRTVYYILSIIATHGAASPTSTADFTNSTGNPRIGYMWNPYSTTNSRTEIPFKKYNPQTNTAFETLLSELQTSSAEPRQSQLDKILSSFELINTSSLITPDQISMAFKALQDFLNREYDQLSVRGQTQDRNNLLQEGYDALALFCERLKNFKLFSTEQLEILKCYEISMLIGAANMAGKIRDNSAQLRYLQKAKSITETITSSVSNPYGTKGGFDPKSVLKFLERRIEVAMIYLRNAGSRSPIHRPPHK